MVKTTLYYGPKRSIGCPFFPIFHENINTFMPIFCQKTSILSKTHCSHAHSLSKKHPFSQKHCALMLFFFVKNTSILSKPRQKSKQDALFFKTSRINHGSYAHILSKNLYLFYKKANRSHSHTLSKKRPFSQKHCVLM